jgi:hypothetical protein
VNEKAEPGLPFRSNKTTWVSGYEKLKRPDSNQRLGGTEETHFWRIEEAKVCKSHSTS